MTNLAADQSPHQRQLLDRASRPDLRRWLDHTATRAVVSDLSGSPATAYGRKATGRIVRTRAHHPASGRGALRALRRPPRQRCPPCAEIYRADTYQLINAGLIGGKGVPTPSRTPGGVRHPHCALVRSRPHASGNRGRGRSALPPAPHLTVCPHGKA